MFVYLQIIISNSHKYIGTRIHNMHINISYVELLSEILQK